VLREIIPGNFTSQSFIKTYIKYVGDNFKISLAYGRKKRPRCLKELFIGAESHQPKVFYVETMPLAVLGK